MNVHDKKSVMWTDFPTVQSVVSGKTGQNITPNIEMLLGIWVKVLTLTMTELKILK